MSSANNPKTRAALADTNVLLSSFLLRGSTSFRALAELGERYTLLLSMATLDELERVVRRSKFDRSLALHERLAFSQTLCPELTLFPFTSELSPVVTQAMTSSWNWL